MGENLPQSSVWKFQKMSFELPPPTAGIWLIPKRFRQLCRLAGFVKMTGVPIFRNKIQGLPFHHQETTRKKMGRNAKKHQRTCYLSIFRGPIFSCNGWFLWWNPRSYLSPAISCKSIHPSCRQPNHPSTSSTFWQCWCSGVQRKTEKPAMWFWRFENRCGNRNN